MIYISIDNDHHGGLALSIIKALNLKSEQVTFISHLSKRNNTIPNSTYDCIKTKGHPLSDGYSFKNPVSYIRAWLHQAQLNQQFNFQHNDTLLILTEYQLNNALIARQMKNAGGQVYIFDEGIGFFFNNSAYHEQHTTVLNKLFLAFYNAAFKLLNIPAYSKKGFEGRMYVRIRDQLIDKIYARMRLPVSRTIPIQGYKNFLVNEQALLPKQTTSAIFFANNLACFGLKESELVLSGAAIKLMAHAFSHVYIKVHPADWVAKNDVYDFYQKLSQDYSNITLIDNSMTGNDALENIRPQVVVGTLGAVMFDAFFFGCQPIFLFHLLPPVAEFDICRYTLDLLGYQYINKLDQIQSTYCSNVDADSLVFNAPISLQND